MYSVEYKWTKLDTPVTTINIVVVKASKWNPQLMSNKSEAIHLPMYIVHVEPITAVSKNDNKDRKNDKKMAAGAKKQAPLVPI